MISESIMQQTIISSFLQTSFSVPPPHHSFLKASCDMGVEACEQVGHSELSTRPEGDDFYSLTLNYLAEIFFLLIAPFVPIPFLGDSVAIGLEAILLFIPAIIVFYIYAVPFVLSLFYIIFGANFFLFSWLDNVLVLLIEHFISNIQLALPLTVLGAYLVILGIDDN